MHAFITVAAVACAVFTNAAAITTEKSKLNHDKESSTTMRMRAVPRESAPSNTSTAKWFDTSRGEDAPDAVTLRVTASVPSVNLENVPGFLGVECSDTTATAKFTSVNKVSRWKVEPTLLLIASQYLCGQAVAREFTMLLANTWTINHLDSSIVFKTADPEASGITGTFELIAKPQSDPLEPRNPDFKPQITLKDKNHVEIHNASTFSKRSRTRKNMIPVEFDHSITESVTYRIPGTNAMVGAYCTDCGAIGDTVLTIQTHGTLFPFTAKVSAEWSGSIMTAANVAFVAPSRTDRPLRTLPSTLYRTKVHNIDIPGVFGARLMFRVLSRADFDLSKPARFDLHLGAMIPDFKISMSTDGGFSIGSIDPVYTGHVSTSIPTEGSVGMSIIPELGIDLTMFNLDLGKRFITIGVAVTEKNNIKWLRKGGLCMESYVTSVLETGISFVNAAIDVAEPIKVFSKCYFPSNL